MALIDIFPTRIYKTQYPDLDYILKLRDSDICNNFPKGQKKYQEVYLQGNVDSSLFSWYDVKGAGKMHQWPEFKPLSDFMEHHAKIYWDMLGYYPELSPQIYQSVITVYTNDGFINLHNHPKANIAGVLYMDCTPDQGNIIFENPMEQLLSTTPQLDRFFQEVECNTGDLLLFPGYLKHYTAPNKSGRRRMVFIGNMNTTGVWRDNE